MSPLISTTRVGTTSLRWSVMHTWHRTSATPFISSRISSWVNESLFTATTFDTCQCRSTKVWASNSYSKERCRTLTSTTTCQLKKSSDVYLDSGSSILRIRSFKSPLLTGALNKFRSATCVLLMNETLQSTLTQKYFVALKHLHILQVSKTQSKTLMMRSS